MTIAETIVLNDEVSGSADAAAAATLGLADALDTAAAAARKADGSAEAAASSDTALGSAAQSAASSEKSLAAGATAAAAATQKGASGALLNADALVRLGEKAVKAAMAVGKLIIAIGKAAVNAVKGREQLKLMLDQATKGHGTEALAGIEKMAKALGMGVQETTEQFVKFREQGLKNIDSANLIKLRADLLAVGVSADAADEKIAGAAEAIKAGGDAKAIVASIASEFGAVGNGANAAAARVYTVEGALDNAKAAGERFVGRIGDAFAPALTGAANAATELFDAFEAAPETQMLIEGIKVAAEGFGEGFKAAAKPLIGLFKQLGVAIGGSKNALENTKAGFKAVGAVIGAVVTVIGAIIVAVLAIPSAFAAAWEAAVSAVSSAVSAIVETASAIADWVAGITEAVGNAVSAVGGFVGAFFDAGVNLIKGFIDGILSMAAAVGEAVSNLGSKAAESLKNVLGIGSPSKVAKGYGENFGGTFSSAVDDTMPAKIQAPVFDSRSVTGGKGFEAKGSSMPPIVVNVNVSQTNATPSDIQTAVTRGVESGLRMAGVV